MNCNVFSLLLVSSVAFVCIEGCYTDMLKAELACKPTCYQSVCKPTCYQAVCKPTCYQSVCLPKPCLPPALHYPIPTICLTPKICIKPKICLVANPSPCIDSCPECDYASGSGKGNSDCSCGCNKRIVAFVMLKKHC